MKGRDIEKKIYKLLGVNLFRKYILGTYGKLMKSIIKYDGYKIKGFSSQNLKSFKDDSKVFGKTHVISLIICNSVYTFFALSGDINPYILSCWFVNNFIDLYSIMSNRQHCIRIDEILEKREEKEKPQSDEEPEDKNPKMAVVKTQMLSENLHQELSSLAQEREALEDLKKTTIAMYNTDTQNQDLFNQEQELTTNYPSLKM